MKHTRFIEIKLHRFVYSLFVFVSFKSDHLAYDSDLIQKDIGHSFSLNINDLVRKLLK